MATGGAAAAPPIQRAGTRRQRSVVAIPALVLAVPSFVSFADQIQGRFRFGLCRIRPEPVCVRAACAMLHPPMMKAVPPTARRFDHSDCPPPDVLGPESCGPRLPAMALDPGHVSPIRSVPADITRPDYVGKRGPGRYRGPDIQDDETIAAMRRVGKLAAQTLEVVGAAVRPGITTDDLDRIGHEFMCDHGAYPSTLGYRGYPKSLCTSINEVICHGIPDSTVLQDGDIVNVDVTAYREGVHGDTDATFLVGAVDEESRLLVERTREALRRGIAAVAPGREIGAIGRVIESFARRFGYGVVRDFTGHGIGHAFHTGLVIPHYDDPGARTIMAPGMTFTIEPMLTLGTIDHDIWDDGWTVVTRDRRRSAQFEHTVLVTAAGPEILTAG